MANGQERVNEGRQEPEVRAEEAGRGGSGLEPTLRTGTASLGHKFPPCPAACQGASAQPPQPCLSDSCEGEGAGASSGTCTLSPAPLPLPRDTASLPKALGAGWGNGNVRRWD